jgi:trigger factor
MKKKLLALLLAGCMVLAMTACGSKETEESTEPSGETAETTQIDTSALGTSKLIELGAYKEITYKPMDTVVTEEEVEAEVQYLVSTSVIKNPQEIATETSIVNIDYEGKKDGVAFAGGTKAGHELDLANSTFIDGFAESIVGMKVGETKDCPMTFPEEYHTEDLAGADVVFTITVNDCWENVPAQLNDEFAKTQGYDTVEALYAGLRELMETAKMQEASADTEYQILAKVIENSKFELNEEEVNLYVTDLKSQYEQMASYYGYDLETYVSMATGMSMEQFEAQCREIAVYRIQCPLIQNAIAEKEALEVTDEIYQEKAETYMAYYGFETVEDLETAYTKETVMAQVISDMAVDFLVENAVAEEN